MCIGGMEFRSCRSNEEDPQALYGYDLDGNRISMDDVAGEAGDTVSPDIN